MMKFLNQVLPVILCSFSLLFFTCSSDDDASPDFTITVNNTVLIENANDFNGDIDGDFVGNGGSGSRIFTWQNNLATADYNADITATTNGSFNMVVRDADGMVVLDRSLIGGQEPDSFDGVTSSGASGLWTVTISLVNFNGDGSFSLSEGN